MSAPRPLSVLLLSFCLTLTPSTGHEPETSLFADLPDWSTLDPFQERISADTFGSLIHALFVSGDPAPWITWDDRRAIILTDRIETPYILRFSGAGGKPDRTLRDRVTDRLGETGLLGGRGLEDLHLAIDPGHIGGDWADIEHRRFRIRESDAWVVEGDLVLAVAETIRDRLEPLGTRVSLVRADSQPVTDLRPEDPDLEEPARMLLKRRKPDLTEEAPAFPGLLRTYRDLVFYRVAEIRARAETVNTTLQPDLVLCLHLNAAGWPDPEQPTLVPDTNLHVLVNGAYLPGELALEDQRFDLVKRLLAGWWADELVLGEALSRSLAEATDLPPYTYGGGNALQPYPDNPYLWSRNLMANRLYDAPVVFLEPYIMNSVPDYAHIQAGRYEGLKPFRGKPRPNLIDEYADAVIAGLQTALGR
ncbi:MAG: hypothetical protein ACFE0O_12000 [Opitutales bacterium]